MQKEKLPLFFTKKRKKKMSNAPIEKMSSSKETFIEHLGKVQKIIKSWPLWKRKTRASRI